MHLNDCITLKLISRLSRFICITIGIATLTSVSVHAVPFVSFEGEGDEFFASGTFKFGFNSADTPWVASTGLMLGNRGFNYHVSWDGSASAGTFELDLFFQEFSTLGGSSVVFPIIARGGPLFSNPFSIHLTGETRFGEDFSFINQQGLVETVFSHGLVDTFLDWDGEQLAGHGTWTWERIPDSGSSFVLLVVGILCCVAIRMTSVRRQDIGSGG